MGKLRMGLSGGGARRGLGRLGTWEYSTGPQALSAPRPAC